jgi:hypothetical protein
LVYEKSEAGAVCTLDGILSRSTAPGCVPGWEGAAALAVGAGAGAGLLLAAGAVLLLAGGAVLLLAAGAVLAVPVRAAGALRAGGATGVVAMTRTSGSFVVLELSLGLEDSCAAAVPGAIAGIAQTAQSSPQHAGRIERRRCASATKSHPPNPKLWHNLELAQAGHFSKRSREVLAIASRLGWRMADGVD